MFKDDELTGAYNIWILRNINYYSTIVLCDLDNFKYINDKFGHNAGDRVLKSVTNLLMNYCSTNDFVCRYGGDEFLIIYKYSNEKIVKELMKIACNVIYTTLKLGNYNVSFSVGISSYKKGKSLDKAIKDADKTLYYSKESGRNKVTCYSEVNKCAKKKTKK